MFEQVWDDVTALHELERLIAPGLIGFYDQVEITHIFMRSEDRRTVSNVLTIIVLEENYDERGAEFRFLNESPIEINSIKNRSFGVARCRKPVSTLLPAIDHLLQTNEWILSSTSSLHFGPVSSVGCQFVPPDAITSIPLNSVLKNNFWNGSYVFEWTDRKKAHLDELFEMPKRLHDLSEAVRKYVPAGLASLSDRLGNLVVQLPVRILISSFYQRTQRTGELIADVVWHPRATPRPLKATCRFDFDDVVQGFAAANLSSTLAVLPAKAERGTYVATIWDDADQVVLASTGASSFIESIPIRMHVADPEPRVLSFAIDGKHSDVRVRVVNMHTMVVGRPPNEDWNGGRTFKRMYRDEISKLKQQRRFVHYHPRQGDRVAEHMRAIEDIRLLINTYGEHGVWLWDPYLTSHDILETLVYCPYSNSDLRGMGSNKEIPEIASSARKMQRDPDADLWRGKLSLFCEPPPIPMDRIAEQRAILDRVDGNWRGVRLEYRIKHGNHGWGFHDRFIIFPGHDRGALAWSLGTSINSLGKEHHILQQVDDGQLVMDEFQELWDRLDHPETIVWKKP